MIGRTHSEGQSFGTDRSTDSQYSTRKGRGKVLAMLALLTSFAVVIDGAAAGIAPTAAVLPRVVVPVLPSSTQFDITGFPTAATLDPVCYAAAANQAAAAHCGGTVTINGHIVIVPAETIAIMPAAAFTWEELFFKAPAPYGLTVTAPNTGPTTGMALTDFPKPLTTYEFQAVGNRVINGAGDRYIAGLIHVSQSDLNGGAGYISYIDYVHGVMEVGGTVLGIPSATAARVMINDPALGPGLSGRYGRAANPAEQDPRFMVDQESPTITSATGYPMCLPRVLADPSISGNDDAQCPLTNRPIDIPTGTFQQLFTMNNPNLAVKPVGSDPLLQAPFEVGDYITFSGSLAPDPLVPTGTMISAHTIVDNTAIFTADGTDPAYIMIEVSLIGTGGLQVFGAGEATIRTRFEGKSTDRTRPVYLYGIDYNPADGSSSDRYFGTIMPDPGPPVGAVTGRWRFRPPCLQFGTFSGAKPDKTCVNGPDNSFLPPPRELRAVIAAAGNDVGANPLGPPPLPTNKAGITAANGITYGQYHAPIGEYLFPENRPGNPVVENNFNSIPFLAAGGYSSNTGTVAGQLNPWPSNALPIPACSLPVPNIGTVPATLSAGVAQGLSASSTGTSPTFAWSTTPAVGGGTFSSTTITNPTWTAPSLAPGALPLSVTLHFTVSNACAVGLTSSAIVVVTAPPLVLANPTVNQVPALSMFVSQTGTFTVSGSDPNVPASLPLTFTVTGAGAPLVSAIVTPIGGATSTSASVQLITSATPGTVQLTITATNSTGQSSAPITAILTVSAAPADVVTITSVVFRTLKLRLILTVTDAPAGNAVLKLQPYEYVSNGVTRLFNPINLGTGADTLTNGGGGLYTMSLVGAPQPRLGAAITVTSNLGGSGSTTAITIRL